MQGKALGGTIALLVLIVLVVLLLGRDGTQDASPTDIIPNEQQADLLPSEVNLLPVDENGELIEEATTTQVSRTATTTANNTVNYASAGFNPKKITIREGETVTWTNNSAIPMWVASAVHPTHTLYPVDSEDDCLGSSFDACTGIEPGKSWSYTFTEVGEWDYHDHLSASRTGTVVVE